MKKYINRLLVGIILLLFISHHYFILRWHYSEANYFDVGGFFLINMITLIDLSIWIGIILLLILLGMIE